MGKVKLTREQAEAIEKVLVGRTKESVIRERANPLASVGVYLEKESNLVYREIEFETLIKALYIGYEVEETFEVGDWVIRIEEGSVNNGIDFINVEKGYTFEVTSKNDAGTCVCGEGRYHNPKKLRHATPEEIAEEKERRWWAKHNRKVWEIQEGDCLISKHDKSSCQVKFVEASDEVSVLLVDGIQDEFYEGEHDLKIMRDRYDVFCFAEDRKDIKQ